MTKTSDTDQGLEVTTVGKRASGYDDDLRLAMVLADQVDNYTMSRFKADDLQVTTKPDLTPVTDADRQAEEAIRGQLSRTRSRDAILGEEFGETGSGSRKWILDPIDGTKNFVRRVPIWATLIALTVDSVPVVGVVSAPALNRRWWASAGGGAWTGRSLSAATQLRVSAVSGLDDAFLGSGSLKSWQSIDRLDQMVDLQLTVWRQRIFGDFWPYMLIAEGAIDVAMDVGLGWHDVAALDIILSEAGGRLTSLEGEEHPQGGTVVASNGLLHDDVLRHFSL